MNPARGRTVGMMDPVDSRPPDIEIFEALMGEHPVIQAWMNSPCYPASTISDHLSRKEYHRTGIYREFYQRYSVEDQLGLFLAMTKPLTVGVAFNRPRRSFKQKDRAVMDLMQPHLAQAYRNAEQVTRLKTETAATWEALEQTGLGVVLVSEQNRPVRISDLARGWLLEFLPDWKRMPTGLPEEIRMWLARIGSNADDLARPGIQPLVLERPRARLLVRYCSTPEKGSALILERREEKPAPGADLPPRYRKVLFRLLAGESEKQVAFRLGLSRHTVHTYVKALHKHYGVQSRGELLARFLRHPVSE